MLDTFDQINVLIAKGSKVILLGDPFASVELQYIYIVDIYTLQYDKTHNIIHIDCALIIYSEDRYDDRLTKNDVSKAGKDSERIKLFRIDGEINPKDAFGVLALYYYNNFEIRKYFDTTAISIRSAPNNIATDNITAMISTLNPSPSFVEVIITFPIILYHLLTAEKLHNMPVEYHIYGLDQALRIQS
jgi:hypothetical protein